MPIFSISLGALEKWENGHAVLIRGASAPLPMPASANFPSVKAVRICEIGPSNDKRQFFC